METALKIIRVIRWIVVDIVQIIGVVIIVCSLFSEHPGYGFVGIGILAFGMLAECVLRLEDLEKSGEKVIVHLHGTTLSTGDTGPTGPTGEKEK